MLEVFGGCWKGLEGVRKGWKSLESVGKSRRGLKRVGKGWKGLEGVRKGWKGLEGVGKSWEGVGHVLEGVGRGRVKPRRPGQKSANQCWPKSVNFFRPKSELAKVGVSPQHGITEASRTVARSYTAAPGRWVGAKRNCTQVFDAKMPTQIPFVQATQKNHRSAFFRDLNLQTTPP